LNSKSFIEPLKENSNKKLFYLSFMKENPELSFKVLKKWISLIYPIPFSERDTISSPKISTS